LGWSPLQIGLAMLPAAAFGAVAARITGATARPEHRSAVVAGYAAGCVVGLLVAASAPATPVLLVSGLALVAGGFAGGQVVLVGGIPSLVADRHRNVALGVFNLLFFLGGMVGAAATGGLSALVPLHVAVGIVAVLPATGVVLALRS
jgi:MFS transporter, DHA2 family, metal-tetracycline-proton antiporter